MEVTFDLSSGNVLIEGVNISLTADGEIIPKFMGFHRSSSSSQTIQSEYRSCKKFTTLSSSADLIVAVDQLRLVSICILFDWIVFFDRTLLESKSSGDLKRSMVRQSWRFHRLLEKSENFHGETLISHTIRTMVVCCFVLLTSLYKRDGSASTHIVFEG
jgi:hypothetical protein